MEIKLPSGRMIGDGHPVFIIAEVGSNWRTLEDCANSISQAKACGADAVKFQAYDHQALYGCPDPVPKGGVGWVRYGAANGGYGTMKPSSVRDSSLPLEWLPKLKEKADAVGIEFMCSAFSTELLGAVDPHVNIHKLASAEMCHVGMLKKLREIGKPVIVSTGAQHIEDIQRAVTILGGTPKVFMYCVAAYPARLIDFFAMISLQERSREMVGFSDHSTDALVIPSVAVANGAVAIEKHVNFVGATGPDAPHSLTGDEFKAMVKDLRRTARPGWTDIGPAKEEKSMITRHKRRLIATREILEGDTLTEGVNFGIYRSLKDESHAFSPFRVDQVNGKTARKTIRAGDGIGPGDV